MVPKGLLTYYSSFFDRALNGQWEESSNGEVILQDASAESFELVVQWMYTSNAVLPPAEPRPSAIPTKTASEEEKVIDPFYLGHEGTHFDASENVPRANSGTKSDATIDGPRVIAAYLGFFILADRIDLLGPFNTIISRMDSTLALSEHALQPEHIRAAAQLPRGHPVRKLFAQACTLSYMADINNRLPNNKFRFRKELADIESFASDLLQEFDYHQRLRQNPRLLR